jgi:alpha-mannosidase
VAVEENGEGVALVNAGNVGAEVAGGTIWTTLLRAPVSEYAGMVADETSSQHGHHTFQFSILPYRGSWSAGECIQLGQELNSPVHCRAMPVGGLAVADSLLTLAPSTVVLSSVKAPEDEAPDEMVVRFYEATGKATKADLSVKDAQDAWHSDLTERKLDSVPCFEGRLSLDLAPFEIKTVRIRRRQAA